MTTLNTTDYWPVIDSKAGHIHSDNGIDMAVVGHFIAHVHVRQPDGSWTDVALIQRDTDFQKYVVRVSHNTFTDRKSAHASDDLAAAYRDYDAVVRAIPRVGGSPSIRSRDWKHFV
jgi:hypothetical protein